MPKHIEKVRAHAKTQLGTAPEQAKDRKALLASYKKFLKIEEHRIRLFHKQGGSGEAICQQRSQVLDIVLQNLFALALEQVDGADETTDAKSVTLVAQGGYGRGLLNPGSDLDLLFLTPDSSRTLPTETSEIIEAILYMLWDTGFKVGHAVRSVNECIKQAKEDPQALTAMVEMRLITGDSELLTELREKFYKTCISGKEDAFLTERLEDRRAQRSKYSNTVFLQEPHVKNGPGGLRDYHNLRWLAFVKFRDPDIASLVKGGLLSGKSHRKIERAHDFLLRVRNDLHYTESGADDILTLRLQGKVATHFNYPQKTILRRVEEFMRDYYTHTGNLLNLNSEVFDRLRIARINAAPLRRVTGLLPGRRRQSFDGFYVDNDRLYAEAPEIFDEDPPRLMRAFQHAQMRGLRMSAELCNLIQSSFTYINRSFRERRDVRETFEAILFRKGAVAATLRQMHRLGFLGKYIPEFGALTYLVQHEFFHRYTADEHTLTCIDKLDELLEASEGNDRLYGDLLRNIEDPFILYLALILHDTGRAANLRTHADASALMASKVAQRMRLTSERRKRLLFLVDHHLTLWSTGTSKNIADPGVIAEFAETIGSQEYLDTLLILTVADSRGTSEQSWTSWKEALILQLYYSTSAYYADTAAFQLRATGPLDDLKADVAKKFKESWHPEVDAHFEHMPDHYFRFRGVGSIERHIRQFHAFFQQLRSEDPEAMLKPVIRWHPALSAGHTKIIIASWDRHRLLARIAGSLSAARLNILGADLYRRNDDLVLDVFRVCTSNLNPDPRQRDRDRFEENFAQSLIDPDWDPLPQIKKNLPKASAAELTGVDVPKRVFIDVDGHPNATLIQIQTTDRIGLLFDLLNAIAAHGHQITHARIGTQQGVAVDFLYLLDKKGNKLTDPEQVKALKEDLEKIVL